MTLTIDVSSLVPLLAFMTACLVLVDTAMTFWLHRRLSSTNDAVVKVAHEVNSVKDELVASTAKESFARGVKSEKENPT